MTSTPSTSRVSAAPPRSSFIRWVLLCVLPMFSTLPRSQADIIQVNAGQSIQDAVDSASSGDEIVVAPGEYREHVYIESLQNVTVRSSHGPGATHILIQADEDYAFQARSCRDVTISGFTVIGAEHGTTCTDMTAGIFFVDSTGVVENCDIDLFTGPALDRLCFRHGIVMQTWMAPGPLTFEVRDCTIRGFQLNGLFAYGNNRQMRAYRNRIEGVGTSTTSVQYGILVRNFASVIAEGNILKDLHYINASSTASAILTFGANTTLSHASFNNFSGNQAALISLNSNGTGYSVPLLSANDNYWGDPSGPGGNSPGAGDAEFGALYSTIWDQVHAYDPISGQDWALQSSEGNMIGARFLDQGHLYPAPPATPFHRGLWLEYEVDQLPYLGNPTLTIQADANIPTPVTFDEYSIRDDAPGLPFWHAQPVSGDDGDQVVEVTFGTQGDLGNEETSWLAVGAFQTLRPTFTDAHLDSATGEFVLSWTAESGHSLQIERSSSTSGTYTAIATVPADDGTYRDPIPASGKAHFYRIRDLGPTP